MILAILIILSAGGAAVVLGICVIAHTHPAATPERHQ